MNFQNKTTIRIWLLPSGPPPNGCNAHGHAAQSAYIPFACMTCAKSIKIGRSSRSDGMYVVTTAKVLPCCPILLKRERLSNFLHCDTMSSQPASASAVLMLSSQHPDSAALQDTLLQLQLLTDSVSTNIQHLFDRVTANSKPTAAPPPTFFISPALRHPGAFVIQADTVRDAVAIARQHLDDTIQKCHDEIDTKILHAKRRK